MIAQEVFNLSCVKDVSVGGLMDDATLFYIIASGIAIVASGSILFLLWQLRP